MVEQRTKFADPLSGQIRYTTIVISRTDENGQTVRRKYRCKGPIRIENQYERARADRPPRTR